MSIGADAISLGVLFKLDRNYAVVAQRAHNAGGAQVACRRRDRAVGG